LKLQAHDLTRIAFRGPTLAFKDLASHFGVFWDRALIRSSDGGYLCSLHEWLLRHEDYMDDDPAVQESRVRDKLGDGIFLPVPVARPGIAFFYTTIGRSAALLSCDLIHLEIDGAGAIVSHQQTDRPFGVVQHTRWAAGLECETRIAFSAPDVLAAHFRLRCLADTSLTITPHLSGAPVSEERFQSAQRTTDGQIVMSINPAFRTSTLNPDFEAVQLTTGLPIADTRAIWAITTTLAGGQPVLTSRGAESSTDRIFSIDGTLGYGWRGQPIELAPGATATLDVWVAAEQNDIPDVPAVLRARLDEQPKVAYAVFDAAQQRWNDLFAALPALSDASPSRQQLYGHAVSVLRLNEYHGAGKILRGLTASYCTRGHGLCVAHYWDSCFSAVGIATFDPVRAQQAIEVLLQNPATFGAPPECVGRYTRTAAGQAPIEAWAAWRVYQASRDRAFLERVYGWSKLNNQYWFSYRDADGDGLCEWRNGGQIGDDSPRWDKAGVVRNCKDMGEYESPDLNGFLHGQMCHLALMAGELGHTEQAREWEARAEELRGKMLSTLYFPEDDCFYDVDLLTHQPQRVIAPNHFIPLWAGVSPGKEEAELMIRRYLLDPAHFWGETPFPSISFTHPAYEPYGYWRGRIWPHFAYWMVETLWAYGFQAEADLAAERLINMIARWPYLQENYSGDGQPSGIPEYNWTAATTILLLQRAYRMRSNK